MFAPGTYLGTLCMSDLEQQYEPDDRHDTHEDTDGEHPARSSNGYDGFGVLRTRHFFSSCFSGN